MVTLLLAMEIAEIRRALADLQSRMARIERLLGEPSPVGAPVVEPPQPRQRASEPRARSSEIRVAVINPGISYMTEVAAGLADKLKRLLGDTVTVAVDVHSLKDLTLARRDYDLILYVAFTASTRLDWTEVIARMANVRDQFPGAVLEVLVLRFGSASQTLPIDPRFTGRAWQIRFESTGIVDDALARETARDLASFIKSIKKL